MHRFSESEGREEMPQNGFNFAGNKPQSAFKTPSSNRNNWPSNFDDQQEQDQQKVQENNYIVDIGNDNDDDQIVKIGDEAQEVKSHILSLDDDVDQNSPNLHKSQKKSNDFGTLFSTNPGVYSPNYDINENKNYVNNIHNSNRKDGSILNNYNQTLQQNQQVIPFQRSKKKKQSDQLVSVDSLEDEDNEGQPDVISGESKLRIDSLKLDFQSENHGSIKQIDKDYGVFDLNQQNSNPQPDFQVFPQLTLKQIHSADDNGITQDKQIKDSQKRLDLEFFKNRQRPGLPTIGNIRKREDIQLIERLSDINFYDGEGSKVRSEIKDRIEPRQVSRDLNRERKDGNLVNNEEIKERREDFQFDYQDNHYFEKRQEVQKPILTSGQMKNLADQDLEVLGADIDQLGFRQNLVTEIDNIEKQKQIRHLLEKFIICFNQNPKEGIQFLNEKKLCRDDEYDEIAGILLTTEGLSQQVMGQYFGSANQKNQKVLDAFCRKLDFRNLEFDQALRLFLSRFRLPGEAQQIERIVTIFSSVYFRDNPGVFKDEDSPFIMTYAAIMLNVDAHNTQIEQRNKMKKEIFVKNNLLCTRNMVNMNFWTNYQNFFLFLHFSQVSQEFVQRLFDNIQQEKFETHVDNIQRLYARMKFIKNRSSSWNDSQSVIERNKILQKGSNFLKYGRNGKPHTRQVWLSQECDMIYWQELTNKSQAEQIKAPRFIHIFDVEDIALGHNTTEVMRKNNVPIEFDQYCFSVITEQRTLDLKAMDVEAQSMWVSFLLAHLLDKRDEQAKKIQIQRRRLDDTQDRISEIWRVDIFPHWENHWDYNQSQPKNQEQFNGQKGIFEKLCSCLSKVKQKRPNQTTKALSENQQNNRNNQNQQNFHDFQVMYPEQIDSGQNQRSFLLITLWQIGIPNWVRKTIWPLSIGNQLQITENLYRILLKQVYCFSSEKSQSETAIENSLKSMEKDFMNNQSITQKCPPNKINILQRILKVFIFYRPDIGYIPKVMANIVSVMLNYLDEYDAFCCFMNLLHSNHFLSLFKADIREIEWRVRFFDQLLRERLPYMEAHFKALDLTSDLFLINWLLDLFSSSIGQLDIVSRIWDNFLYEGEIFAFKCSLALIEYFQLELKMSTFNEATEILQNIPDLVNQFYLFQLIQDINIDSKRFSVLLEKQKIAKLNPQIHQALLN